MMPRGSHPELEDHDYKNDQVPVNPEIVWDLLFQLDPCRSMGPDRSHPRILRAQRSHCETSLNDFGAVLEIHRDPSWLEAGKQCCDFQEGFFYSYMKLLSPLGKDFYLSNTVGATGTPSKGGGIFTMEFSKVEHNRIRKEKVDEMSPEDEKSEFKEPQTVDKNASNTFQFSLYKDITQKSMG
ncbi:hypothetical protein TURU_093493 [Turdus rufiventris]|nr:hypothetical protein TURU_093493 [Turdus rufiventris]